jgi:hypothetical protein
MAETLGHDKTTALVRWTYSSDEWNTFMRWKKMKKGFLPYLLHRLLPRLGSPAPEVIINRGKVSIGDVHEPFSDCGRQLKRINIHDAGKMNVMEIAYQHNDLQHVNPGEIHIPVPRGKLKEAIQVQEKLLKLPQQYRC